MSVIKIKSKLFVFIKPCFYCICVKKYGFKRSCMCQAIREMMEDSRMEGIAEGEARGEARGRSEGSASQIIEIIENIMSELQCSLEKACKVAGKTVSEYRQSEQICGKT